MFLNTTKEGYLHVRCLYIFIVTSLQRARKSGNEKMRLLKRYGIVPETELKGPIENELIE